jgi:cytoskeleton protein RodZ
VLEIGSNLREARGRRELPLAQIDADTHIRTRYLKALEDERFDLLPGPAYVRGFLRTYADYLGLDADLFVDEYNMRFAPAEESPPDVTSLRPIKRGRPRVRGTTAVVLLVASVGFVAWSLNSGDEPTGPATIGGALLKTPPTPMPPAAAASPPPMRQPRRATLVLTAGQGSCWLLVRAGSSEGRYIREGMLAEGDSVRLVGKRLWIRLGAPQNLEAKVNGRAAALPDDTANVVVTAAGIRTVARS